MANVALITGSAVRLGREIAQHLAIKGWDLALHYNSSSKEISDFETDLKKYFPGQRFYTFQADLGATDQTQGLLKFVLDRFGHLDLLINNASVFERSSLKTTSTELMILQMMINYMAPFILMHEYANNSNKGLIINIVDTGISQNNSDYLSYSLSKKSLWELTKMAALELAPHFRVNAIAPGAILPPAGKDKSYLQKIALNTPMKIPTGVNPVLKSIDYIIDNEDLTGQLIYCDGGGHLL